MTCLCWICCKCDDSIDELCSVNCRKKIRLDTMLAMEKVQQHNAVLRRMRRMREMKWLCQILRLPSP